MALSYGYTTILRYNFKIFKYGKFLAVSFVMEALSWLYSKASSEMVNDIDLFMRYLKENILNMRGWIFDFFM